MSTGKRPLDRTAQEESEVIPKALKLGDSGDEYKTVDEKIHQQVQELLPLLQRAKLMPAALRFNALQIIYHQAVSDGHIGAVPEIDECAGVESDPEFSKVLQNAIDKGHYKDVMSLALTRYKAHRTAAAELAWSEPYRGSCHEILLMNINAMERQADYATSVTIIQSSGTGKSRMVDEQANLVFTIPFNLRDPEERMSAGAYPCEDAEVRNYLCNKVELKCTDVALDRAILFFGHLFLLVANEVRQVFSGDRNLSPNSLARRWRTYLSEGRKRSQLYKNVIEACKTGWPGNNSVRVYTETQSKELLSVLATFCNYPKSDDVQVILYFDEAHEFNYPIPHDTCGRTLYDIVWSSLGHLGDSVFTIFLSTQSLTLLAPSTATARSARQQDTKKLNAPITETPFDCHPSFPLQRGQFKLEDLGDLCFLARFGRPLFWTMLKQAKDDGATHEAMNLARVKLVFDNNIRKVEHTQTAMLAVLDILITIDFEPRRDTAHKIEMDMVASHIRTAFSVSDHRLYIRSGYPSEPFLAEAASRQMHFYIQRSPSTMISILKNSLDHGLIDLGQRGEVVMRVLLRKAYMEAIVAEADKGSTQDLNFSKGCSFLQFLKALFADRYHDEILNATPENGVEARTLEDAFKDAVVRFTHFVKAVDDSVVKTEAMEAGFMRGSAFICCNCQKEVDIIIPVLLDKNDMVAESSMSALLIQVKRRKRAGGSNAYIIDQETLHFFPDDSTTKKSLRPYVTLLAELGVNVTLKSDIFGASHCRERAPGRLESMRPADHPKYSLRAEGCTDKTWKVIRSTEHADYIQVLGRDDLLDDHPRQNEESLQLVRTMLPFWYEGAEWVSKPLESAQPSATVDVGDGSELSEEERMDEGS